MPAEKILSPLLLRNGGRVIGVTVSGASFATSRHELRDVLAERGQRPIGPLPDGYGSFDVEDLPAPPAPLYEQWRALRDLNGVAHLSNYSHLTKRLALAQFTDGTCSGVLHIWTDEHGDHAEIERVEP